MNCDAVAPVRELNNLASYSAALTSSVFVKSHFEFCRLSILGIRPNLMPKKYSSVDVDSSPLIFTPYAPPLAPASNFTYFFLTIFFLDETHYCKEVTNVGFC